MNGLSATLLQFAIAKFSDNKIAGSALCIWAAQWFDEDPALKDFSSAFQSQILDRIESAQKERDFDLALQLDGLNSIFAPDNRLRLDSAVAAHRALMRCADAERALSRGEFEATAAFSLAALAMDPANAAASKGLGAAARGLCAQHQLVADEQPTPEGTLALALAVALGARDQRRDLAKLLYGLADYDAATQLCRRVEGDESASFDDRFEAMQLRLHAKHRSLGADQATAEARAAPDVRAWLAALGPSAGLEEAALRTRVAVCFASDGYRQTLADLRELRRLCPADEWVAFNLCLILFNALHPDVQASVDLVVQQAGQDPDYLEPAYMMMSMIGAMPQALTLAERLSAHRPEFALVGLLHRTATDLDAPPAAVFGRARQGRRLLYANLACWGDAYIALMEKASIASLLAPGNVPALSEKVDLVVELFTMPSDLTRLLESPALRKLGEYCELRLHVFPDAVAAMKQDWGYVIYGYALHATALRAERDGADLTFFLPDLIYGDGAYARIAEEVTSEPRAVFADGFNTLSGPMFELMEPYRRDDRLVIPPQALIEAMVRCLSARTVHSLYPPGDGRTCQEPTRIIFPMKTGLRTHGFMMLPAYVSHAALAPFKMINFRTQDGLFLEHILNKLDDNQVKVVSGMEFCYTEVCESDGMHHPMIEINLKDTIRNYFASFGFGRNRLRLFNRPIDYPTLSPPDLPLVSVEEADARVREIQEMFATDPIMTDLAEEQERIRQVHYR